MRCPLRTDRRDGACDHACAWCIKGAADDTETYTCAVREAGALALLQRKGFEAIATASTEGSGSPQPHKSSPTVDIV